MKTKISKNRNFFTVIADIVLFCNSYIVYKGQTCIILFEGRESHEFTLNMN